MAIFNLEGQSPKVDPILPGVTQPESMTHGTGNELNGVNGGNYSRKVKIIPSLIQQGKELFNESEFGNSLRTLNDMIKDPRYAIYKGLEKYKQSLFKEDGLRPSDRIIPDNNPNISPEYRSAAKLIQEVSNFDPLGGILTHNVAKQFKGIHKYDPKDIENHILTEYRIRMMIDADKYDRATTLYDFTSIDPASGNQIGENSGFFNSAFKGYKTVQGLTLGSNHLWDITLGNYIKEGKPTFTPKVPLLGNPNLFGTMEGHFIPATSFVYQDYETDSESVDLINGGKFEFIKAFRKINRLTIEFLEDADFTWSRYFDLYMKSIYNRSSNSVAPYKQSVLLCCIAIYNPERKVYFKHKLLIIPIDFQRKVEGEDSANVTSLEVEFSVVGDLDEGRNYDAINVTIEDQ